MAHLLLRGIAQGPPGWSLKAMLFDKDGTISRSEPMLLSLSSARLRLCRQLAAPLLNGPERQAELGDLLGRAYGLLASGIDPAGITAVASRDHNLIATATALVQVGLGWPEALALSEELFTRTDDLHGQRSEHRPEPTEGLAELVASLTGAGVTCAVISNDHSEGIDAFLAAHRLQQHFQDHWSAGHRPAKPDPGAVHGLCTALGVNPGECALIGDANSDLRMARAAGVPVVLGYQAGWLTPPPLDAGVPQLHHWRELQVAEGPVPTAAVSTAT
ncbi:MAG: HAD family hydrolase [Cyanobium sp.]